MHELHFIFVDYCTYFLCYIQRFYPRGIQKFSLLTFLPRIPIFLTFCNFVSNLKKYIFGRLVKLIHDYLIHNQLLQPNSRFIFQRYTDELQKSETCVYSQNLKHFVKNFNLLKKLCTSFTLYLWSIALLFSALYRDFILAVFRNFL